MSAATMLSFPIGPILGGYLLDHFWWGSVFLINVPVVVIALVAVMFLLPESRSVNRPSIDVLGVLVSSAGLIAVTYGCIKAGQNGWGNVTALATIAVGLVLLACFVWWARITAARRAVAGGPGAVPVGRVPVGHDPGDVPVVHDVRPVLRAAAVLPGRPRGDSLGSGLRLLPMVLGMVVGMIAGTRLAVGRGGSEGTRGSAAARRDHGRVPGHRGRARDRRVHHARQLDRFTLAWVAVSGLGFGLVMPSAMNVTLASLTAERSGSGSALISAMRQVGSMIGVAVLGTLISNAYASRAAPPGCPGRRVGGPGRAWPAASRWRTSSARPSCSTRSGPRSSTAWTSCCGPAAASRVGCALLAVVFLRPLRGAAR